MGKFKQWRQYGTATAVGLALCLLAACSVTPAVRPSLRPAPAQPLASAVVVTPDADHDLLAQLLAGEMALAGTDLKTAAAAYNKAAVLSTDPHIAERALSLSMAVRDDAAAQADLARWQALGARPEQLARARAQLALLHGDTVEAQRQLQRMIATGGKDVWRDFGHVLLTARDSAQAAALLEALATPDTLPRDDPTVWLAASELGEQLGRPAYAQRLADEALKRFPITQTSIWAAQLKIHRGDLAGAMVLLQKAMAHGVNDPALRLAYASLLIQRRQFAQASSVLSNGEQTPDVYGLRVALAAQMNDQSTLRRLYDEIRHGSEQVREDNVFVLGQLAETLGRKDEALSWYAQVDDDQHAFDAGARSALILLGQGKSELAHQQAEQLQTDYMDHPEQLRRAYALDAEMYAQEQNYAAAIKAFGRALQIKPDDTTLLYERGLAYAELGQTDASIADFRQVLALKPDDVDASNALGYTLADAGQDLTEAQQLIDKARAAKPNDPAIEDSWGWLQYRLGHLDQAAQTLNGAWQAMKDADVGVHLGEVLWKLGRRQEAQHIFDEVQRRDPANASLRNTLRRLEP